MIFSQKKVENTIELQTHGGHVAWVKVGLKEISSVKMDGLQKKLK